MTDCLFPNRPMSENLKMMYPKKVLFRFTLFPTLSHSLFLFPMNVMKFVQSNLVTICPVLSVPFLIFTLIPEQIPGIVNTQPGMTMEAKAVEPLLINTLSFQPVCPFYLHHHRYDCDHNFSAASLDS